MTAFTIFPAIDLRNGRVVRLEYGDPERQTVFGDDPVAMGQRWLDAGASWLHVVNLDGAFDERGQANRAQLPLLAALDARIQFGGGLRDLSDIETALLAGADRVILGTVAIEQPALVSEAVQRFGSASIVVGIDARDGLVRTRGWQQETAVTPGELATQMKDMGVSTIVYTDISRDGVLSGVNAAATADLARTSGCSVIASGGVADLADIVACQERAGQGIAGVITGRAIYDGRLDLKAAFQAIA